MKKTLKFSYYFGGKCSSFIFDGTLCHKRRETKFVFIHSLPSLAQNWLIKGVISLQRLISYQSLAKYMVMMTYECVAEHSILQVHLPTKKTAWACPCSPFLKQAEDTHKLTLFNNLFSLPLKSVSLSPSFKSQE